MTANRVPATLLLLVLLSARLASQSAAGSGAPPVRLMIGPEEYLRAPNPFPQNLPANASSIDSIRARNLAPRVWGMANARPCRAVAVSDTTGWAAAIHTGLGDAVLLPPGLMPDTTFRSYHGGLRWASPELALSLENGWWGVPYDSAGYLTACRAKARSGEYLVNETRTATGYSFSAIPWVQAWGPSRRIVGSAGDEEGLRVLWTAFALMVPPQCRYMTGSPVRDPTAPPC